ncbi:unnamed protein product [Discula destructiva]
MSQPAQLTARETEIAVTAWRALEGDYKINFQELANLTGLKNINTARAIWNPIKKKVLAGTHVPATSTGATSKKRTAAMAADNTDNEGDFSTPAKKPRGPSAKKSLLMGRPTAASASHPVEVEAPAAKKQPVKKKATKEEEDVNIEEQNSSSIDSDYESN